MDDSSSSSLLIFLALLVLNSLITLVYAALQNIRQSELEELAASGVRSAKNALALRDSKSQLSVTIALLNSLLNYGGALLIGYALLLPVLTGAENALGLAPAIALTTLAALVIVIFGDVVPESIGSAYAMPVTKMLVGLLRLVVVLFSPLTLTLLWISRLLARIFGSSELVNTVTEEEIMSLVNQGNTGGTIEDEEREMIYSILQLDQTLAREVMVPRIDMVAVDVNTSLSEALDNFLRTGYSRLPAYEENVDNIVGLLYAKDLLNLWTNGGLEGHTVRELVRSAYFVPETRTADDLLRDLQARNVHMAIVVDEYGGTSGLVTIENILEEIVGDIRDEFDQNEEYEYIEHGDDEYTIDAGMDLDDINELLNTTLETEHSDTLGGFIYLSIGRVPIVGETIETDEVIMTVRSLEGRRIRKVFVKRKPEPSEDDEPRMLEQPESGADDSDDTPEELADAS